MPYLTLSSLCTFQPAQATTRDRLHQRSSRPSIMDAQWQQYYWNHYLLQQQQHQQLANTEATATHPPASHHTYHPHPYTTPTATHATTTDSTIPAGIPTPTTPTTQSLHRHRLTSASPTAPRPFTHATTPRLLEPNRSPLGCQHTARPPALPRHTTYTMVS